MTDRTLPENEQKQLESRFGVHIRTSDNHYSFSFTAGGTEHTVDRTEATAGGLRQAYLDLQKATDEKIRYLEKRYKVSFARAGEDAEKVLVRQPNCERTPGDMAHAVQPTLPQLFAVEEALKRSRPSQLSADGKQGVKIYFLDQSLIQTGPFGTPVKGLYTEKDKDGRPAVYIMPGAAELPPTPADVGATAVKSLQWGVTHEIAHNSEKNAWKHTHEVPDDFAQKMGWHVAYKSLMPDGNVMSAVILAGKDGKYYSFDSFDCHNPSWILTDARAHALGRDGKPLVVDSLKSLKSQEVHFSKEEVRENASVKPISPYFINPAEMTAESIAAFRGGRASRARLLRENADLYNEISKYDERELARFYGVDARGRGKYVRTPEGFVVRRESATVRSITSFESENRAK